MHGGAAPQVRAAARRRLFEERERRHAARWESFSEATREQYLRAFIPMLEHPEG